MSESVSAPASREIPPRAYPAFLLSLAMPGLGHCRAGFPGRGAGFFLLHFLLAAGLIISRLNWGAALALILALRFALAAAAFRAARRSLSRPRFGPMAAFYLAGLVLGLSLRWLVLPAVEVEGASMEPSLRDGDVLLSDRWAHRLFPPRRGEVVVALNPRSGPPLLVKRIAAVGPEVFSAEGKCWTIPPAGVFLLGDNPSRGPDSRYFGPVESSAVLLCPLFVVWSWDRERERVRWERIGRRI